MDTPEPVRLPDLADLEKQLAEFWRQASSEDEAVTRACTLNLIVACREKRDLAGTAKTIALLSEQHPGRTLMVSVDAVAEGESDERLAAYVSAHCHRASGGARVCSEQITLEAHEKSAHLIPETVLQLLVGDCPVYTWWRRPRMGTDLLWSQLARISDRFIVDSATFPDPVEAVTDLASLASSQTWGGNVGDLLWVRLERWRELVASQFDSSLTRGYLDWATAVQVTAGGPASERGVTAAGAYLAGWLASRLGWRSEADGGTLRRKDGGRVRVELKHDPRFESGRTCSVSIECSDADRPATFVVERLSPEEDAVRLRMETEGACPLPYIQKLAGLDDVSLLCGELERDAHDSVLEDALASATLLASAAPAGN